MSEAIIDPPAVTTDPFGSGLESFLNKQASPVTEITAPVEKPVETEKVETTPVETPTDKPFDLRSELTGETTSEEAVTEEPEETKEYPPEIRSIKAREHFDALKTSKKAAEKRAQEFESRIKELESKAGVNAPEVSVLQKKLEAAETKIEEMNKEVGAVNIERTDEFKAIRSRQGAAVNTLKSLEKVYELSSLDISKLLDEPDEFKRNELASDIAEGIRGRANQDKFYAAINEVIATTLEEADLYENHAGSVEFAKKKQDEEQAEKTLHEIQQYKKEATKVLDILKAKAPKLHENQEVWSKIVDSVEKTTFENMEPWEKGMAIVTSQAISPLIQMMHDLQKENDKLKSTISSRASATPGAGPGTISQPSATDGKSFVDGMMDILK